MKAKLAALFDSQARQSEKLVAEFEEHMKLWPDVQRQYELLDAEAIALASKLRACLDAGSPTWISVDAELRRKRWARDGVKAKFTRERDRIFIQLEHLTAPHIRKFCDDALIQAQNMMRLQQIESSEVIGSTISGIQTVRVTHNTAALVHARDTILDAIKVIRAMSHSSLPELQKQIAAYRGQFANLETDTWEISEMSQDQARDLVIKEETLVPDKGFLMPDGKVIKLAKPDTPRIAELSGRLDKLEKGTI